MQDIQTFRARTMQEALDLVRATLGPDAAVLHTREVNRGLLTRLVRGRRVEIAASASVNVPSRLTPAAPATNAPQPAHLDLDYRAKYREDVRLQFAPELDEVQGGVRDACSAADAPSCHELPDALFRVYTDMIEAAIDEPTARSLLEHVRRGLTPEQRQDAQRVTERLVELIQAMLPVTGGIAARPGGRRVVALVGPTGVGKTTTIAKLAANFRLREHRRVGLVTVDTYRVAAVEQLRTYADIIDLPMEVVSTPREMREAVERLAELEVVLIDTAGRSPRDEVKIQELKSMLGEARPDEVHLVLSCAAGAQSLATTVERFEPAGVTSLLYTKLDEATSLGHLIAPTRACGLPISYLTDGQNVPDDIQVARSARLAQRVLEVDQP